MFQSQFFLNQNFRPFQETRPLFRPKRLPESRKENSLFLHEMPNSPPRPRSTCAVSCEGGGRVLRSPSPSSLDLSLHGIFPALTCFIVKALHLFFSFFSIHFQTKMYMVLQTVIVLCISSTAQCKLVFMLFFYVLFFKEFRQNCRGELVTDSTWT